MYPCLVAAICVTLMHGATSLSATITPGQAHIKPGDNLTLICRADAPIAYCQIRGSGLDFNTTIGPLPGVEVYNASLAARECTTVIDGALLPDRVTTPITCRVRTARSDWAYSLMLAFKNSKEKIPLTISSRQVVAMPGRKLNLLFKAEIPLSVCNIRIEEKGDWEDIYQDHQLCTQTNHCYHGKGVDQKECGLTINNLTTDYNGITWFFVEDESRKKQELDFVLIIVATPPNTPAFISNIDIHDNDTVTLKAVCTATGGRPAASLSWYLDGVRLPDDAATYIPGVEWVKLSSLKTVKQKLTLQLNRTAEGKHLWCAAEHITLSKPKRSRVEPLSFLPPKTEDETITSDCPPRTSTSTLFISCFNEIDEVDCSDLQPVGTVARLRCMPGYKIPPDTIYTEITCLEGGIWDQPLYQCSLDCGRRNTNAGHVLISHGNTSKVREFPWHVGVYYVEESTDFPTHICGGTLITPEYVVSAAHCFWDITIEQPINASHYKIAAGKVYRLWEDPDPKVKKRDVLKIGLPDTFRGRPGRFASDIAIMRLSSPVIISTEVNVICLDWRRDLTQLSLRHFKIGSVGVVAGWGVTENNTQSVALQHLNLPLVSWDECHASLIEELQPILTPDKFCAGFVNKTTSVCGGDSGGGLAFLDFYTNQYYLRGVVSVAFQPSYFNGNCYAEHYTGFTTVSEHLDFIKGHVLRRTTTVFTGSSG